MKNDQWFEVGDKVMRVARHHTTCSVPASLDDPKEGVVYCVEAFGQSKHGHNVIRLVGMRNGPGILGFVAANFRKVEEIQLCVKAAQMKPQPEPTPAEKP